MTRLGPSEERALPRRDPQPLPAGLRWALLAHPAVQAVRFGTKLALAWFLLPEAFGRAYLAGSLAFAAGHLALLGLDEAWVATRRPGPRLAHDVARLHQVSGLAAALLTALAGFCLRLLLPDGQVGLLLMSLAPMVLVANLAVLPTARLVREQDWPRLFALDLLAVSGFSAATLAGAVLGADSWSLVAGWSTNAVVTLLASRAFVAGHHPLPAIPPEQEDDLASTRRRGLHLYGAQLSAFLGERLDGWFVAFGMGPAALSIFGLYEKAQYMGGVLVGWAGQLSERALFPALSARHRDRRLAPSFATALRAGLSWLLPAHLALALLARPLVEVLLPPVWLDAAPLLLLLALAAGARCLDVIATTALKAGEWSRAVATLGVARLALLSAALVVVLPRADVLVLAQAVLAARVASALVALGLALVRVDSARSAVLPALRGALLFGALALPVAWGLERALGESPLPHLLGGVIALAGAWALARLVGDRSGLRDDLARLRQRIARSGAEAGA